MTDLLKDTGERMIPEFHKGRNIYGAHIGRYQAGRSVIKDKIVLDIACGSGYGTKLMAPHAKEVYGVDIDKQTITYAKKHFSAKNITYLVGNGTEIPLDDDSVDVVVSYETIEHIEDYEGFMKEVKRVLKKNGLFLLSTPNDAEYMEGNHFHIHEFVYDELKSLVGKYFKHHKDYFQTLWLYSSILPSDLQAREWELPLDTVSTISLKPEQCIYFFLLCSDIPIDAEIKPVGVIGEHYRQRALQEESRKRQRIIQSHLKRESELEEEKEKIKKLYHDLGNSESYRLGRTILSPVFYVKKLIGKNTPRQ